MYYLSMLCAPVPRPAWWPFTGLVPIFQHTSLSGEPQTGRSNTPVKLSTGIPNKLDDKPSPPHAYNILTNIVQCPLSHHCHMTTPLTHGQLLVPQDPLVLFLLSSQLVPSLCCCRGLFRCRTCLCRTSQHFIRFLQLTQVPQGPYPLL